MNNIWLNKKTPVGFIGCFYNIHFWVMLKGRRKKESTEFLYCCNPGVKGEQSHGRGRGRQADAAARQVWEADDGREGRALQSISHQTFSFKQTVNLKGTVVITNLTFWLTRTCEFHPVIPPSDPVTNRWIRPHLLKEIWSYIDNVTWLYIHHFPQWLVQMTKDCPSCNLYFFFHLTLSGFSFQS